VAALPQTAKSVFGVQLVCAVQFVPL